MVWVETDGSCDENDKFFPVLVRHFYKDGLITTSLLDIPDIGKGSDAKTMLDVCSLSLKKANLSWELCCKYSSDNTRSMVRKNRSFVVFYQKCTTNTKSL